MLLIRSEHCSLFLVVGIFQLQAKANAVMVPILAEAVASAAAEEGPRGEVMLVGPPCHLLLKTVVGLLMEPRHPKTKQRRPLLILQLARCESRGP